ncbi:MAG: type II toxin-antitoxin system RelE/ParE family toxin [Lewinellaceae bacterium]|nr:type II toxin-antitoxin system RelE/ParE family toxin [Lewinellaceae bacterium]
MYRPEKKACEFPYLYAPFYKDLRKFRLSKFPYKIIYRVQDEIILIVAVAHDARSDYWKEQV